MTGFVWFFGETAVSFGWTNTFWTWKLREQWSYSTLSTVPIKLWMESCTPWPTLTHHFVFSSATDVYILNFKVLDHVKKNIFR